jgi:hypothetical protein
MAVLLRHFEQRSLAEIGARLGLSENAARMRVDRALAETRITHHRIVSILDKAHTLRKGSVARGRFQNYTAHHAEWNASCSAPATEGCTLV